MRRQPELHKRNREGIAVIFIALSFFAIPAYCQVTSIPGDTAKKKPELPQQEDVIDIAKKILKIKLNHQKEDSAKLQPWVIYPAMFPAIGYTLVNGGTATIAGNISFYTDSINKTNLSSVYIAPLASTDHQYTIPIIGTVWTKDNQFNILSDWRYYKYPSYTYGLGGFTTLQKADLINYSYVQIIQEVLYHVGYNIYAGIGYNYDLHYNVEDLNSVTDYSTYNGTSNQTVSSGMTVHIKYDSRANINNPRDAFFGSIIYKDNSTILGSNSNWKSVQLELRDYITLGGRRHRNVLAFWNWDGVTYGGKVPYFDLPSTGWDTYANTGRGYIQGRFRGTSLLYMEGEYRFQLLANGLLGGVVFLNGESVPEWPSNKFETVIPGEGIGLRIKMNHYSDANLCIDYAFGNEGSHGFFFNLGEVF
ncbi:MAG: hypothetical protein ACLQQ4_10455 [Bacteroidia bacterium]